MLDQQPQFNPENPNQTLALTYEFKSQIKRYLETRELDLQSFNPASSQLLHRLVKTAEFNEEKLIKPFIGVTNFQLPKGDLLIQFRSISTGQVINVEDLGLRIQSKSGEQSILGLPIKNGKYMVFPGVLLGQMYKLSVEDEDGGTASFLKPKDNSPSPGIEAEIPYDTYELSQHEIHSERNLAAVGSEYRKKEVA